MNRKIGTIIPRSVYGLVITATLLFSLENHENSALDVAITIILTIFAVSSAEYYARSFHIDNEITSFKNVPLEIAEDSLNMMYGSAVPIVLFILSGFGIITIFSAFSLSEVAVAILLTFVGYYYGKKSGKSNRVSAFYAIVNLGLVTIVLLLELWAHYHRL